MHLNDIKELACHDENRSLLKKSGRKMCFNTPNYPLSQIISDAKSVVKEQALHQRFAMQLEDMEKEKEVKIMKRFSKKPTHDQLEKKIDPIQVENHVLKIRMKN